MNSHSIDAPVLFFFLFFLFICFIIGILITRWIFKINNIVYLLERQNAYSLIQIRLLKRTLMNAGMTGDELNKIIQEGNHPEESRLAYSASNHSFFSSFQFPL